MNKNLGKLSRTEAFVYLVVNPILELLRHEVNKCQKRRYDKLQSMQNYVIQKDKHGEHYRHFCNDYPFLAGFIADHDRKVKQIEIETEEHSMELSQWPHEMPTPFREISDAVMKALQPRKIYSYNAKNLAFDVTVRLGDKIEHWDILEPIYQKYQAYFPYKLSNDTISEIDAMVPYLQGLRKLFSDFSYDTCSLLDIPADLVNF